MKKKVLSLLALCLQAREVGEFIEFDYCGGCQSVSICCYEDYQQMLKSSPDEVSLRKLDYCFYLDGEEEDALELIAEIETEILKLIETAKAK